MSSLVEKFKNKKVFILYLVGVLLLSTSVSFAYFTSRTNASGEGGVAVGTTTVIESEGINAEGTIEFNNVDMYPGHIGIAGIKVIATGTTPMIYNVIFNGTNTFTTPLNYTVYKTTTEIDVSYTCTKKEERQGVNTIYYEECTGNNIEQLGAEVSRGTIHTNEGKTTLLDNEVILGTEEGAEVYYYVVIEFPNEEANQNDDIGSSISGNITIEEGDEYKNPQVTLTGITVSGNNGWVKSASINVNVETQTGKYEALYCTTTEDSCTPNTSANISDNTFSVTLNNNSSAQKVCVQVTDEYNQIASGCSEFYQVDGEIPNVTIASTSVTENSITVTVNGSDTHSGIVQYKFSNNNGSSYTDINTTESSYTYTFNNLESGTTYNIAVQVIDAAGNINSVSQSIETEVAERTMQEIIAGYNIGNRGSFSTPYTSTTTNTVFTTSDWKGTSYYFAGAPTDNWVRFGGFYWRIVRVNGDGSVRLIYNGTSTATTGTGTLINSGATYPFNSSYTRSEYVGLKYTTGEQHGQTTDSPILNTLQLWYSSSGLSAIQNSQYIDTSIGFCSDRNMASGYSWSSTGSSHYYAVHRRLVNSKSPSLACTSSDIIKEPVGLITADEVAFAGGGFFNNKNYYLYSNQEYWTMSPYYFNSSYEYPAYVLALTEEGELTHWTVRGSGGVRSVINLKADTKFQGSGTVSDPYTVVGAS